jgi:uncharacterized membrane protein YphA (DoxX/SURF4 family)
VDSRWLGDPARERAHLSRMTPTLQHQPVRSVPSPRKALAAAAWVVSVPLALMFIMAGASKLRGVPMMVGLFEAIGIGQWFRYLTGSLEILGAALLFVPRLSGVGALTLAGVMLGAIATHLFIVGGSIAMPVALLVGALFVAYVRRDRVLALLGR